MTDSEQPTVTEYDVRHAAQRYGAWFGARQGCVLDDSYDAAKRDLAELQGALAKSVGGLQ